MQETIRVARVRLAHNQRRAPERIVALAEAEARLEQVEEEVLIQVSAMPMTRGRIPWLRRLPSFARMEDQAHLQDARDQARARARAEAGRLYWNRQVDRADAHIRQSVGGLADAIGA